MKLKQEYKKWMKTGELPENGLCRCLSGTKYKSTLRLFRPSGKEKFELIASGFNFGYWGSGLTCNDWGIFYKFTPLRQTIVLLILAMHDEL